MKTFFTYRTFVTTFLFMLGLSLNAQIKYDSNKKLTIGNTTPYEFYGQTISSPL